MAILITAFAARSIISTIAVLVLSLRQRAFHLPPPTSCFGRSILCGTAFDDRVFLQLYYRVNDVLLEIPYTVAPIY